MIFQKKLVVLPLVLAFLLVSYHAWLSNKGAKTEVIVKSSLPNKETDKSKPEAEKQKGSHVFLSGDSNADIPRENYRASDKNNLVSNEELSASQEKSILSLEVRNQENGQDDVAVEELPTPDELVALREGTNNNQTIDELPPSITYEEVVPPELLALELANATPSSDSGGDIRIVYEDEPLPDDPDNPYALEAPEIPASSGYPEVVPPQLFELEKAYALIMNSAELSVVEKQEEILYDDPEIYQNYPKDSYIEPASTGEQDANFY